MTKVVDIKTLNNSIRSVLEMAEKGDEIVLQENGEPIAKVVLFPSTEQKLAERALGLGTGEGYFMSEDFDDELSDEFWGLDK